MRNFPQIDPELSKKGSIISEIHQLKMTAKIGGFLKAAKLALSRSKKSGEYIGRSTAEWICSNTGEPAYSIIDLEGTKFGYSEEGELLYPLTRQWD